MVMSYAYIVARAAALASHEQRRASGGDHRRERLAPDSGLVAARATCKFVSLSVSAPLMGE